MTAASETDPHLARALETIARCGHLVQHESGSGDDPALFYTAGLTASADHGYELALSGVLEPETARNILNDAAKKLAETRPTEGAYLNGVLVGNYAVRLRLVGAGRRFGWVSAIYGENRAPVWQVLWPDEIGFFPGDPDYTHPDWTQALL